MLGGVLAEAYFSTLSQSMFTLFFTGCFFDGIPALAEMMFQARFRVQGLFEEVPALAKMMSQEMPSCFGLAVSLFSLSG